MSMELGAYFQQFLENISLGEPQLSRLDSAARTISRFLGESYALPNQFLFLQGSYPNGTAVEPTEGGAYDVDLVARCVGPQTTADSALDDLEHRFHADGRFKDRVKRKKPCVRLEYAEDDVGKFHVDVVPVRLAAQSTAWPLEAPRRGEGWHGTAPAEYTNWCVQQGDYYLRTVKMMKRWRDEQQTVRTAIKSIVLQVLVADFMPQMTADADRLAGTFRALHANLKDLVQPPVVRNPVLQSENLAARWSAESFRSFVGEMAEAVECVERAVVATDVVEAADSWREILGEDFPILSTQQLGIQLGDYSHAQTPGGMGWREQTDPRFRVSVAATVQRGRRGQNQRQYTSNGALIFAGNKLRFKAQLVAPVHVAVWWQVANTGGHAREVSGLRGEIFKGRELNQRPTADESENWESTAFTGSHLIRALLVRNDTVVAMSDWFQVNIYAKGNQFRL